MVKNNYCKGCRFVASFREISRLGYAFCDLAMIWTCTYLCSSN